MGYTCSSACVLAVKVLVISAGVAAALRWSVPAIVEFSAALKPPYVYVILNAIIVTIVASSRCHQGQDPSTLPLDHSDFEMVNEEIRDDPVPQATWIPPVRIDSSEILLLEQLSSPRKLLSSTFSHRKPVRPNPEVASGVKALAEAEENKTLEQTWKMITWNRQINACSMKTSETFKDKTIGDSTPFYLTELNNELSLSQDEFNHRVEAFINQFKEEMRLQREESLNKFKEMINSGT